MTTSKTEHLKRRVDAYFAACDASAELYLQKNGAIGYRQIPYTLAGLAAAAARSEQSILDAAEGQGRTEEQRILSDAVRRIAGYLSERALMGELQATVALSLLSELRGRTPDGDAEDGKLVVVMDDREGWSD